MYTSAQKLSHPAKHTFEKVKFIYIWSELGHLQNKMYLFHNNINNNNNSNNNNS